MMNADRTEILEKKLEHLEQKRLDSIETSLQEIASRQRDMEKQLERYSARWGLVLMVGSALVATVKLFWNDLAKIFGKG